MLNCIDLGTEYLFSIIGAQGAISAILEYLGEMLYLSIEIRAVASSFI